MKKTVKTAVIKSGILAMILIWIAGCSKQDENQRSEENENADQRICQIFRCQRAHAAPL